jgi:hypothetical protein
MSNNELIMSLWCDFEPIQSLWGDWGKFDFWKSAYDLGYPQISIEMAEKIIKIKNIYEAKVTWGIFSCEPFFEWFNMLSKFIDDVHHNGDAITIHPHWLDWENGKGWTRNRAPDEEKILKSLVPVNLISANDCYSSMIRSGWNTQKSNTGKMLKDIYRYDYGFTGIGDVYKTKHEFEWDKDFLILPSDTDSMDDCVGKWKKAFINALGRTWSTKSIFSWWFHVHNFTIDQFDHLLNWSEETAYKNGTRLRYMNTKEIYKELEPKTSC